MIVTSAQSVAVLIILLEVTEHTQAVAGKREKGFEASEADLLKAMLASPTHW